MELLQSQGLSFQHFLVYLLEMGLELIAKQKIVVLTVKKDVEWLAVH